MSSNEEANITLFPEGFGEFDTIWQTLELDSNTRKLPASATLSGDEDAHFRSRLRRELAQLPPVPAGSGEADLQVLSTLGEGGMSVVHLAKQRSLHREVALKSLRSSDPESELRLIREALVTGSLEHPNIVPVYGVGRDSEGGAVVVMKRIQGVSWDKFLSAEVAPPVEKQYALDWHLDVLLDVARAAHFAHSRGVVHRDLKPDNVMIGNFGEVYLVDWGLAVSVRDAEALLPRAVDADGIAGTPSYMAPEMTVGRGADLGPHTDIYLLGSILHEIVTGTRRHRGTSLFEVMASAYESRPFEYPPEVPRELADTCNRAMRRKPEERFATAEQFRSAVTAFKRHQASAQLSEGATRRLAQLQTMVDRANVQSDPELRELYANCRFGFEQALEVWTDNPDAIEGNRSARVAMFRHEIRSRNVAAAAALLTEITEPDPDLPAALQALRDDVDREKHNVDQLRHDADRSLGSTQRGWAAIAFGIVSFIGMSTIQILDTTGIDSLDGATLIAWVSSAWGLWLVLFLVFRRTFFTNLVNREIVVAVCSVLFAMTLFRVVASGSDIPADLTVRFEMFLYAAGCAMIAVLTRWRILICSLILTLGALVDVYLGVDGIMVEAVTVLLAFLTLGVLWMQDTGKTLSS